MLKYRIMKYLLYYFNGFVKKFPLDKPRLSIGRDEGNELIIDDEFMSREHLKIVVDEETISIVDRNTSNGTYVGGERITEALIRIGESFSTGRIEFFLKKGSLDEFETAKELKPVFNNIRSENEKKFRQLRTKTASDIYSEILNTTLREGLGSHDFSTFITRLSQILAGLSREGSFAVIAENNGDFRIHMLVRNKECILEILKKIVEENPDVFKKDIPGRFLKGSDFSFQSYIFQSEGVNFSLIYLSEIDRKDQHKKIAEFIPVFAQEIKLLAYLLAGKNQYLKEKQIGDVLKVKIAVGNFGMKKLIEQAKKFAKSDIFILIQGESGTGKELFARIIHQYSRRAKGEYVAINCAAIPGNLLEAELFGFEKGSFTGADSQKKGKLEISSGGTLILDEISNMSEDLQIKLLRAVQEQEFYRLGGSKLIKVDLRIISITNEDLKEMVAAGKFRKDLYYRLVHRMMIIPPLRERKEDIPVLIHYFTNKYCHINRKQINGYTVKAYSALQDYQWDGNVRELENEINSLVNLAENGESISFEMLSDTIRRKSGETDAIPVVIPKKIDKQAEKEILINLLEKNNWNKSRTARKLNMTYRGLHEKLKRLGIAKP